MSYGGFTHNGAQSDFNDYRYHQVSARNANQMLAINREEAAANELSRIVSDEYLEDIMQHMRHMEDETLPDVLSMDTQKEIDWSMRPYLIDFLIDLHAAFSLLPETLFLAINLLDRYTSRRVIFRQHYQLVGCASLLIASKYGDKKEIVPQINEMSNMCGGLYDPGMFTQMEMHVLSTLDWSIGHPTIDFFLQLMVAEQHVDKEVESMALYLCEMALFHRDFVSTKPSTLARVSLAFARAILGRQEVQDPEWTLVEDNTLLLLSTRIHSPSVVLAKKYSSARLARVAITLNDFLVQRAAISQRQQLQQQQLQQQQQQHALPTTPVPTRAVPDIYSTPQKGHGAVPGVADGYMTPPITPDDSSFANASHQHQQQEQYLKPTYHHSTQPQYPMTPSPEDQMMFLPPPHPQHQLKPQQHQAPQQYVSYFDGGAHAWNGR